MDAGIIRNLKVLYRTLYCHRALDLDEAGHLDIYTINLMEAMLLVKKAWQLVTPETIQNCWAHAKITREPIIITISRPNPSSQVLIRPSHPITQACDLLSQYVTTDTLTLPAVEEKLELLLGDAQKTLPWSSILKQAIEVESDEDTQAILNKIEGLRISSQESATACETEGDHQQDLGIQETVLMETLAKLKNRKRFIGPLPTIEDLVNTREEEEIGDIPYFFEGGDEDIIELVKSERGAPGGGNGVIEPDDNESEEDEEPQEPAVKISELISMCDALAKFVILTGEDQALDMVKSLRALRGNLNRKQVEGARQSRLEDFFGPKV